MDRNWTWELIHTLFKEVDDLKKTTEELKRATHNSWTALEQTEIHFSPTKWDLNVGVPIKADPNK